MSATTLTIPAIETEGAKRFSEDGSVFLTEEGARTHVLLRSERGLSIGELLSNPAAAEIEFDLPEREVEAFRSVDFD